MIITDKFKSYSLFTDEELQSSIAQDIDNMSEAERAVFFELLQNPQFEGDLTALELDRDMVSVEQWIEDDYYMGALGKSIYKPWKDDLLELFESCNYDTAVVQGGIGCLAEHAEIITENGLLAMGDISSPQRYLSYDKAKPRFVQGTHAFVKGKDMLYKVRHASGEFQATAHHKVLCADGRYRRVDQLVPGIHIVSNDVFQGDVLCALSVRQRLQGCLDDYSLDSHLCDELLQLAKDIGQVSFPSQGDAQALSAFCRKVDDPLGRSLLHTQSWSFLPSKNDFWNPLVDRLFFDSDLAYAKISQQSYGIFQRLLLSRKAEALPRIAKALALFVRQTFPEDLEPLYVPLLDALANHASARSESRYQGMDGQSLSLSLHRIFVRLIAHGFLLSRSRSKVSGSKANQASEPMLSPFQVISRLLMRCRQSLSQMKTSSLLCLSALGLVSNSLESVSFGLSKVVAIEKTMTDWYWDLQVPMTNNYVSGGAVHHNSGKSTFSHLAVLRMLYEASCLKNPAVSYGLAPNSIIGFCSLAKSKETARRVVFEQLAAKIQESPYFKYEFAPVKDVKDEIIFPKGLAIICGSSTDTSIIGMNIFGGIIDEVNFWGKVKKTNLNFGKHWGTESKSGRLFDSVRRRMKSRYIKKGKLPGILMLISSKTTKDSFTEQFIRKEKALGNNSTFVRDRSILDMKRDSFGSSTFKVLIGTVDYPSRILIEGEDISNLSDAMVIEIPDDFRVDFENNLEESLRDIAGVSTIAISNFISKLEKINEIVDDRSHPFSCPLLPDPTIWDSRKPYKINWHSICTQKDNGEWVPKLNPDAPRHVHFDPAYTGDSFGVCIAHISEMRPVQNEDSEIIEYQPVFVVDLILAIQGSKEEEVISRNVRELCYEFSNHGFHLAEFSMDTYQGREICQSLEMQGYKAGIYSVDTGISSKGENVVNTAVGKVPKAKQAYWYLRSAIYENRVKCYDYPRLLMELRKLEDTPEKVDHPEGESKDLADSLCGVVWTLFRSKNMSELPLPSKGLVTNPGHETESLKDYAESLKSDISGSEVIEIRQTKVYEKKKPQTLSPKYQKVSTDGTVKDLTINTEDFLVRG